VPECKLKKHRAASIESIYIVGVLKPVGEIKKLVRLNGQKVCDFDGATFKHDRYDREQVAETLGAGGAIAVQVHGGKSWPKGAKVRWRNVRIKEL
tara:strand:+ start:294 stop:578 length:285 start_codon:yes stop_codon:yes gene_type:complete